MNLNDNTRCYYFFVLGNQSRNYSIKSTAIQNNVTLNMNTVVTDVGNPSVKTSGVVSQYEALNLPSRPS